MSAPPVGHPRIAPQDEAYALRRVVAICGHLSTLAGQSTDVDAIARLLAGSVGARVAVLDRGLEVLASGTPAPATGTDGDPAAAAADPADPAGVVAALRDHSGPSGLNTVLAAAARNRRALTVPSLSATGGRVVIAPILVGDEVAGYLATIGEQPAELDETLFLMVVEHAAMICAVVLGRDLVVAAAASRARQQLLEGLLLARDRDDHEVERWARHLGIDPAAEHRVLALALPEPQRAPGLATVETLVGRLAPTAVVASRADEVVAVVPAAAGPVRALAERWSEAVAARHLGPLAIGIGNPSQSPAQISRSYAEARHALAASQRMGGFGGVTAFAELGIQRLFLRVPDAADLLDFADEVVGKLVDGHPSGEEYLATLATYFEENGSPQRAGRRLNIHPNTVTYRIRRVEEITGLSLDVHRDRLMAAVAVEILTAMRN